MKKLILVLPFTLLFSYFSNAQVWFDLGLKGGVGSGIVLNKTLNNDGRFSVSPGFNYFFGGKVGVNFGEFVGITCDVDYGSYRHSFLQSEVPGKSTTESYRYDLSYAAINVTPTFRYTKESSYLEVGPQFSFVRKKGIEDEAYPLFTPEADAAIRGQLTGVIFGFGGHMIGNEVISLMLGLRFNYTFSDLTSDAYSDTGFPFTNYPTIVSADKMTPLNAQIVMELNYSLGYFVKASCGRRTAFLTF